MSWGLQKSAGVLDVEVGIVILASANNVVYTTRWFQPYQPHSRGRHVGVSFFFWFICGIVLHSQVALNLSVSQ